MTAGGLVRVWVVFIGMNNVSCTVKNLVNFTGPSVVYLLAVYCERAGTCQCAQVETSIFVSVVQVTEVSSYSVSIKERKGRS